ncbi:MAG TPA: peptidase [Actinomycetota bacterium]|nr:peptidase [Actinomycetota bacterium]
MTFCLGMKVRDGIVGIADTRITSGAEAITARKISIREHDRHSLFMMTSGLRSVRDKALTYFDEIVARDEPAFTRLYQVANAFAEQVRRVAKEDGEALAEAGLAFNLHTLVGGQLDEDAEPMLYMLYPQGNWVEVTRGTPYFIIGETGYGKPLLDRALGYDAPLEQALKIGYLAFDATRTSATDVDFPIDIVVYRNDSFSMREHRYEFEELSEVSQMWNRNLRRLIDEVPSRWLEAVFPSVTKPDNVRPMPGASRES